MWLRSPEHRPRQGDGRAPAPGAFLDGRSARIAKAKKLRSLVEGLAQRVVQRRAEAGVGADILDDQKLRVAARDEKQKIGEAQAVGEARSERVRLEMIHGDERQPSRQGDGLCGGNADDQSP